MAQLNNKILKEIQKHYPKAVIQSFYENEDCVAILLIPEWEGWQKAARDLALSQLNVSQLTLDFIENSTEEEREELSRLAKIQYHKKALENLQNQI